MSFQIIEGDVVIRDSSGNELAIADAAALSSTKGLLVAGSDGTNARFVKVATDGTVAISAVSLPLPTGAATEATLVSLEGKDFATETTLAAILADTASLDSKVDVNLSTRATEATVATLLTEAEFTTRINVQGQQPMASSTPVVLPSDQSSIPVRVVTSSGDVTADIVTSGSRNAQSIEYPDMLVLLSKISQQLGLVVKHLQIITDEEEEPL